MGNAAKTNMGTCNVEFGGQDLGYTKGFVSLEYNTESISKEVDQEDSAIDELITKQNFTCKVPMAERNLAIFKDLFPGASIVINGKTFEGDFDGGATYQAGDVVAYGGDFWEYIGTGTSPAGAPEASNWDLLDSATKVVMKLSGASGGSLLAGSKTLVIKPLGGTANDWVTFHHAVAIPSLSFSYEKENLQVFEITFRALPGVNGWVSFGDTTAAAA